MEEILMVVIKIVATALAILLTQLIKKVADHFNLKIQQEQEKRLAEAAEKLILETEERFINDERFKLKAAEAANKLYGELANGKEKLAMVVTKLLDKFPGITQEEAEELTHSILPTLAEHGIGAVGAEIIRAMKN